MQEIELKDPKSLAPYKNNSRTHSEDQIKQVMQSIKEFGFTNPVLIHNGTILAGHCRVEAAKRLKIKSVPCIRLDHLSQSQVKAYVIADNKIALNAGWDFEILKTEMDDLSKFDFDTSLTGFSLEELDAVGSAEINFEPGTESDQGKLDEKNKHKCPECGHEF